jgi:hypothetical protein
MPRKLTIAGALLATAAATAVGAAPALAAKSVVGHSSKVKLVITRGTTNNTAKLTLASSITVKRLQPFTIRCTKPDPTNNLVAIAPLTAGQHLLSAPIGPVQVPAGAKCKVKKGSTTIATLTMHLA